MSENNTNRLDSNGLLYLFQRIKTIFTGMFVAKETGKGLSTNDYTTAEKNKLADIASNAQVNIIEGIQKNGTDLAITNKTVNIEVPLVDNTLSDSSTNAVQNNVVKSALDLKAPLASPEFSGNPTVPTQTTTDNSTKAASTAFVKNAIAAALQGKIDLQFSFLQELPASGVVGTFYFIPAQTSVSGVDEWEEYVWNAQDQTFERVGAATLDLTNYFNTTNLPAITNSEIDAILET